MVALDFPPARGGIQRYLSELARRMDRVHVIAPAAEGAGADGLDVERVALARRPGWLAVPPLIARAVLRLRAGRFAGVLLGHVKLAAAIPVLHAAGASRVAVCTYGMEVTSGRWKRLERFGLRRAWRVLTISDYTAAHLTRLGIPPERQRRVPPGVSLPAETPAAPRDPARPVLLTVGRIESSEGYKGHDRVLDALPALLARWPALTYVVIGAGSGLPALAAAVRARGLDRAVVLRGAVPADALADAYARADVFVLPSSVIRDGPEERFEGFGIVYLEAAAYGCPVVAGRAGGAPEAVADGETGLVIDAAEPGALERALESLLADPARRRAMGEAGRRRAAAFTWDHSGRALAAALAEDAA